MAAQSPLGGVVATALAVHLVFKQFEPDRVYQHALLLGAVPAALSFVLASELGATEAVLLVFPAFYASLAASIVLYRISPWHPLADVPGPLGHKVSQLWSIYAVRDRRRHVYIQGLHRRYGDIVRIGPNEISINNVDYVKPVLGADGLPKGPSWLSRTATQPSPPLVGQQDPAEHARRRKPWSRAFTTSNIKGLEHIVGRRVQQFADLVAAKKGEADIGRLMSWLTYDTMTDLGFGGGSEILRDGDGGAIWHQLESTYPSYEMVGRFPWLADYLRKVPSLSGKVANLRMFSMKLAMERIERGPSVHKDIFYYLNNEDGGDPVQPPLSQVIGDSTLVVVAGADTSSSVLTALFWGLLKHPEAYARLQQEVDTFYPPGTSPLDQTHHTSMRYLSAVINEALRLFPPAPSASQRRVPRQGAGRQVGAMYIPRGTIVTVHTYTLQRDPRNFSPQPESFWPERWLIAADPDGAGGGKDFAHDPTAFIPFSYGPANCVGKSLAMMEMRMAVCAIMQRVELRFADGYDPAEYPRAIRDYFFASRPCLPVVFSPR